MRPSLFSPLPVVNSDDGEAGAPRQRPLMAQKTLGISWLNGRFHAASLAGETVTASWSCPHPVGQGSEFAGALAEAIQQTRFNGNQAMVIIDHRSLLFHVQDTPPGEGKMVDQLLEQLVGRSKFFEEKAAWGRLALPQAKGRSRYLLSLLPDSLIQELIATFTAQRIELLGVFPIATVLGDQLRLLAAQETEVILLAADLGDAIHLLLGQGGGQVLFSRTVAIAGQQPSESAAQEINRTLHYAQQQFGATVTKLFVYGSSAFATLKEVPIRPGLAIARSPLAEDPFYFARQVSLLSPKLRLNFIPAAALKKKSSRQLTAAFVVLLATIAVVTTVVTELKVRARERSLQYKARQSSAEFEIPNQAIVLQNDTNRGRSLPSASGSTNDPAVPVLFSRYVASILPDTLTLSRLDVQRASSTNGWQVHIEGTAVDSSAPFVDRVGGFEGRLSGAPFQLRIQDSTLRQMTRSGVAAPAQRERGGERGIERSFFIEGVIDAIR